MVWIKFYQAIKRDKYIFIKLVQPDFLWFDFFNTKSLAFVMYTA